MIGIIVWLIMGAVVGWIASIIMKTNDQQGTLLNIVVGVVGAGLGGLLFRMLGMNGTNINDGLSVYSFVVSLVGAVVLLGLVSLLRRGAR